MSLPLVVLAAETADHSNPLIPESTELFWGFVSFVILFAIMAKLVFPSINKTLQERTAGIEGKLDQAERERREADRLLASYQQKLNEAHAEAARIIDQARSNADRLETELRGQAEEQAQRIVERARESINAERDRALQSLRNEVGGLVVDLTSRVVGESLDRDRHLRLVDQYIEELPSIGQAN